MNIEKEFEQFFEFSEDSGRKVLTGVSAKLFAKHCVGQLQAEVEMLKANVQAEKSVKETIVAQRNRAYEVNDAHLKRISLLERERDQMKASIEVMRMQLMTVNDIAGESMGSKSYDWHVRATAAINKTYDLLRKTPEQHLAEHGAQVIEREIEWLHQNYPHLDGPHLGILQSRANQLRQKAQESE